MISNTNTFLKLASTDYFFYYGEGSLNFRDECESDMAHLVLQSKRSMFFFRSTGAGVKEFENFPVSIMMQVGIPFAVASSVANRNTYVSDGTGDTPDRRIATSQDAIVFTNNGQGNIDLSVEYLLYYDMKDQDDQRKPNNLKLSTAGVR